jgi:hypothetical protein
MVYSQCRIPRGRFGSGSRSCQTIQHQPTHPQVAPRLCRTRQTLEILCQPPVPSQPRKRSLHHPTPRQHDEPLGQIAGVGFHARTLRLPTSKTPSNPQASSDGVGKLGKGLSTKLEENIAGCVTSPYAIDLPLIAGAITANRGRGGFHVALCLEPSSERSEFLLDRCPAQSPGHQVAQKPTIMSMTLGLGGDIDNALLFIQRLNRCVQGVIPPSFVTAYAVSDSDIWHNSRREPFP